MGIGEDFRAFEIRACGSLNNGLIGAPLFVRIRIYDLVKSRCGLIGVGL